MALGVDSTAAVASSVSPIVSTPTAVRAAVERGGWGTPIRDQTPAGRADGRGSVELSPSSPRLVLSGAGRSGENAGARTGCSTGRWTGDHGGD